MKEEPKAGTPMEWKALEKPATEKQERVIEKVKASGFDLSKLAQFGREAGYPIQTAHLHAAKAVQKLANHPKMIEALKKKKITINRLAGKLDELLDATHPKFTDRPDNIVQHKATETCIRILDANPPKRFEGEFHSTHTEVIITHDTAMRHEKAKVINAEIVKGD
jgi:hypothetical protein